MIKQFKDLKVGDFAATSDNIGYFCFKCSLEGFPWAVGICKVTWIGEKIKLDKDKSEVFLLNEIPPETLKAVSGWIEYEYEEGRLDNLSYVEVLNALKKYD